MVIFSFKTLPRVLARSDSENGSRAQEHHAGIIINNNNSNNIV